MILPNIVEKCSLAHQIQGTTPSHSCPKGKTGKNIMNDMMGRWTLGRVGRARQELDVHPELFVTVDVVVAGAF